MRRMSIEIIIIINKNKESKCCDTHAHTRTHIQARNEFIVCRWLERAFNPSSLSLNGKDFFSRQRHHRCVVGDDDSDVDTGDIMAPAKHYKNEHEHEHL